MTNKEFAEKNEEFRTACEVASIGEKTPIKPTTRQASKWLNKKGLAYKKSNKI